MPHLLALFLAMLLPLSLSAGCTDGRDYVDDDDAADDDDEDDDTAGDDDDSTPPPQGSVAGRVVDTDGEPLGSIGVSCCSDETCLTSTTAADGTFTITGLRANTYVCDNLGYPGDDAAVAAMDWSKFFEFVPVGEDEEVTLPQDLMLCQVAERQQVSSGANSLSYAGGIDISFDGSAVEVPFLVAEIEPLTIGGLEIASEAWPLGGLDNHQVLRAWAFAPFEVGLESGTFSVSITMAEALPAGTEVSFMWADYALGTVAEEFEVSGATLSGDGLSVTGEVDKVSLLMLVTPTPQ
jgi:hypothetical protein